MGTETILLMMGIIAGFMIVQLICAIYIIHRDSVKMDKQFEIQIMATTSSRRPDIGKLSYGDLMGVVNTVIDQYTKQDIRILELGNADNEMVSIEFDSLLAETCAKVELCIGPEVKECILTYVSEEFYKRYIYNNMRLVILAYANRKPGRIIK